MQEKSRKRDTTKTAGGGGTSTTGKPGSSGGLVMAALMYGGSALSAAVFLWDYIVVLPEWGQCVLAAALFAGLCRAFRPNTVHALLVLCLLAGYAFWISTLPIATPYNVDTFSRVTIEGNRALAGDYTVSDPATYSQGSLVYRHETKALFLHLYYAPTGSCFWRVTSSLEAANKDAAVKAALQHSSCNLRGPTQLAAAAVGRGRWKVHQKGGGAAGKWTRDSGLAITLPSEGPSGRHLLWPPDPRVTLVHVAVAGLLGVYYFWLPQRAQVEL